LNDLSELCNPCLLVASHLHKLLVLLSENLEISVAIQLLACFLLARRYYGRL
jgi:hypothetical protein